VQETAKRRPGRFVYGAIAVFLGLALASQLAGFLRYRWDTQTTFEEVTRRVARHIGLIVQSQERFGILRQRRLEAAFEALTVDAEIRTIAVLNAAGDPISLSGAPLSLERDRLAEGGHLGEDGSFTIIAPYERLVVENDEEPVTERPMVFPDGLPGVSLPFSRHYMEDVLLKPMPATAEGLDELRAEQALSAKDADRFAALMREELFKPERTAQLREVLTGHALTKRNLEHAMDALLFGVTPEVDEASGDWSDQPPSLAKAAHLSEAAVADLRERFGIQWFVCTLQGRHYHEKLAREIHTRLWLAAAALLVAGAAALAWRYVEHAAALEVRLLRSQETNSHLRDMNLAAAGLAHETKNPLNLIRGQAQVIAKLPKVSPAVAERTKIITEEVDRVTARLNQFMDYSRPVEPEVTPCAPLQTARAVAEMLEMTLAGKEITFSIEGLDCFVQADAAMLRQVFFNLMINAVDVLPESGTVRVRLIEASTGRYTIEVDDSGPGVPEAVREDVFRPYYTTRASGTGLGLAVVRQIALAHQWDISCGDSTLGGACFRISGLRAAKEETHDTHA